MTIVLVGYMGSGKSLIGRILADQMSYKFIDFDEFIENKEKCTVAEIFKLRGEIHFRKLEAKYLAEVLELKKTVIAMGGGTPCYGNNMERILNSINTRSIYLKTAIPILAERLYPEKSKRPLIAHLDSYEDLQEFIGKHLFERSNVYLKSEITITADGKTPFQISAEIKTLLF